MLNRAGDSEDIAVQPSSLTGSAVSNETAHGIEEDARSEEQRLSIERRTMRAKEIASKIEDGLRERPGRGKRDKPETIILQLFDPPNHFHILWNDEITGKLHIWVPYGKFESGVTTFTLEPYEGEPRRGIKKIPTLMNRIVELCRPPTVQDQALAERREHIEELNHKLQAIEGDNGHIQRFLWVHRLALASWLAQHETADVPIALRPLVGRLRELVEEAARLRGEIAANGE